MTTRWFSKEFAGRILINDPHRVLIEGVLVKLRGSGRPIHYTSHIHTLKISKKMMKDSGRTTSWDYKNEGYR